MSDRVDIERIEINTQLAIKAMNDDWSFEKARMYLEQAFSECSPQRDLGFYDIISQVLSQLQFKTKNGFQTKKVRTEYVDLFDYLASKFSYIRHFDVNSNNDEEATLLNEICVNCYNRMGELAAVFIQVASRNYYWGLIAGAISVSKIKKKFMSSIASVAHDAAFALRKYNIDDAQIRANIRVFESEK